MKTKPAEKRSEAETRRKRNTRATASEPLRAVESSESIDRALSVLTQVLALAENVLANADDGSTQTIALVDKLLKTRERKKVIGISRQRETFTQREWVLPLLVEEIQETIQHFRGRRSKVSPIARQIMFDISRIARIAPGEDLLERANSAVTKLLVDPRALEQPRTSAMQLVGELLEHNPERVKKVCALANKYPQAYEEECRKRKRFWYNIDPLTGEFEEVERLRLLLLHASTRSKNQFGQLYASREQMTAMLRASNINFIAGDRELAEEIRTFFAESRARGLGIRDALSNAWRKFAKVLAPLRSKEPGTIDLVDVAVVKAAFDAYRTGDARSA